ncbi:hypothetical protein [Bdellovibrio sp. HCB-162]|uniref:hypothetical protein n=1 Tax=Bdellovibrio sp. HCB-162 TaxID=3394234 RepID=UPI0039BD76DF
MKRFSIYILGIFFVLFAFDNLSYARGGHRSSGRSYKSSSSSGTVRVRGYYRKNGTYVAPHYRTRANSTKYDNWSTKGNVNPYTGKVGTVEP